MIETIEIFPGVTLRCHRDTRFKQGCLSFQIIRPMCREEAALNALLPAVLLRGTARHPDLRAIIQHLDTLYGASVSTVVRRVGDYQTTGLYCGFMDDRFALPGDKVLEPMLAFLEEILLDCALEEGGFLPDVVLSEKRNLVAAIYAELNDKRVYAVNQLLRAMGSRDSFGLPRLGDPNLVAKVTPRQLYDHYQKILRESPIHIFYVGSGDLHMIAGKLKELLGRIDRNYVNLPRQTSFCAGEESHQTENMEISQGKLCMGFTTPITNRCPEFPAMQLMNTILGAGMTSKLFMTVREQIALCYSIGSAYYGTKGLVTVSAGIDFDKEELVRQEVLRQLELCRQGRITEAELGAAKEAVLSSLRATHDSPGAIEGYYATGALSGMGMTPAEYMAAVERVTLEDVVAAAGTVKLHSTYFLKGVSQ